MWQRTKRFIKICLTTLLLSVIIAAPFVWWEWDEIGKDIRKAINSYREARLDEAIKLCVADLPTVDRVVVMKLAYAPVSAGQSKFSTAFWGGDLYLAKEVSIIGRDAEVFAALWRTQKVTPNKMICHNPHHAVRFYANEKLICETIICFSCVNASLPASIFGRDLVMFDDQSPSYLELKAKIEKLVGSAD